MLLLISEDMLTFAMAECIAAAGTEEAAVDQDDDWVAENENVGPD